MRARIRFSLLLAFALQGAWAQPRLFVFYPSLARPLAIQEAMAAKCPKLEITVFGRLADFQAMVDQKAPQAILAQAVVLRQFPAYAVKLQGQRKGAGTENYVLLSIDKPVDPARMNGVPLGVVGMLERKPMADFVKTMVPGSPRLDRVIKVEDLLPLLIFRSARAVLVSESNVKEFQKKSQANLIATRLENGKVGLSAVAVREGLRAEDVTQALQGLDQGTMELLGVDAWK